MGIGGLPASEIVGRGKPKEMKHMRSIINAVLAAAVAGSLAFGAVATAQDQGGQGGGQMRGGGSCMRDAMAKLNPPLSDDQKAKLKELRDSGAKGPDAREARDKILTPEQQAQLRDARKACAAGGGQG
jgi:Spy/CpxP family protein refolding chaperone